MIGNTVVFSDNEIALFVIGGVDLDGSSDNEFVSAVFIAESEFLAAFNLSVNVAESEFSTVFSLNSVIEGAIEIVFSLNSIVEGVFLANFNLNEKNSAESEFKTTFSLQPGSFQSIELSVDAVLSMGGVELDIMSGNISQDEKSWTWDFSFEIADQVNFDIVQTQKGSYPYLVLSMRGISFNLMAEGKSRSIKDINSRWSIAGRGITARLDGKSSIGVDTVWRDVNARTIIQELCDASAVSLDYQEVDFLIKELDGQGRYPIDIIKEIANSTEAVIQTSLDGTLIIRPSYKTKPDLYPTTSLDFEINDMDDYVSLDEQWLDRDNYDVVSIGNSEVEAEDSISSPASISIKTEDIEGSVNKLCKIYTVPFIPEIQLEDSAESGLILIYQGVNESQVDIEYIEIINGTASLSLPFYSLVSSQYIHTNLGAITISESGDIKTETEGQSLLKLSYMTKYHQYEASRTGTDKFLQVFAEIEA